MRVLVFWTFNAVFKKWIPLSQTSKPADETHLEVGKGMGGITEARLGNDAGESEHGQTSILKLPKLHAVDLLLRLSFKVPERIKAEVAGLAVALALADLDEDGSGAELDEGDSGEKETH